MTEEELKALALAPKKTSGDEGSVEERDAKDAIELDIYYKSGQITGPPFGMRIARVSPRGSVPPS